jgi:hypothetical protein
MTLDLRYITHPLNQQLNAIQHHWTVRLILFWISELFVRFSHRHRRLRWWRDASF